MVQVNPTFGELDKNIHGFKVVVLICPLLPLTPEDPVCLSFFKNTLKSTLRAFAPSKANSGRFLFLYYRKHKMSHTFVFIITFIKLKFSSIKCYFILDQIKWLSLVVFSH